MSQVTMETLLVSGGTGFVGRHLVATARGRGIKVNSLSRGAGGADHLQADLTHGPPQLPATTHVWNTAGLAHRVPRTSAEEQRFFDVNARGTEHLLRGLENHAAGLKHLVHISTVAVYGREQGEALKESCPLEARDPYGHSKIEAERLVRAWGDRFQVPVTILRLPLVAGIGAPGNWGAMVAGITRGRYLGIGPGDCRRSMVLVGDLCQFLVNLPPSSGTYHLTDGVHPSFFELETAIAQALGRPAPLRLPLWGARTLARCGDLGEWLLHRRLPFQMRTFHKMTRTLTFDDTAARRELGWRSTPILEFLATPDASMFARQ